MAEAFVVFAISVSLH